MHGKGSKLAPLTPKDAIMPVQRLTRIFSLHRDPGYRRHLVQLRFSGFTDRLYDILRNSPVRPPLDNAEEWKRLTGD